MANMANVLGLIFANMHEQSVADLTKQRTLASVPFGGRYRMIDFPLSNMVFPLSSLRHSVRRQ